MKKIFTILCAVGLFAATASTFTSCREKSTVEKIADDVEDAVD
jgi:hypothetical protein